MECLFARAKGKASPKSKTGKTCAAGKAVAFWVFPRLDSQRQLGRVNTWNN
jgi:hypothetical protein